MATPSVLIVIPTYNEAANLPVLLSQLSTLSLPLRFLVIDDNSPDGTGRLADQLSASLPLTVIHRSEKRGLGTAYSETFSRLVRGELGPRPNLIIQMDADLSHAPAAVPALINAASSANLIIGSRYILGGRIENWNLLRRLLSRAGNFYARLLLRLPYRDLTSGFKCYHWAVLSKLPWRSVSSVGYNFQIETVFFAHQRGFSIREIPIVFTERRQGNSKLNFSIILESFWKVAALRLRRPPQKS